MGLEPTFCFAALDRMIGVDVMERLRVISRETVEATGFEFVHAEAAGSKRRPVIRIYIDKPGGITLDDCADASRAIEQRLDADDLMPSAYILEVSSPGIERGLYRIDDFKKFEGHSVRLKTIEKINGKASFTGLINGVEGDSVAVIDRDSGRVVIDIGNIKQANLKVDLGASLKG